MFGNGRIFKYNAPVSSQEDVNKLYSQIHKHSEQDQLAVMRREIKFKKVVFSELPDDFVLFKQYNISAKQMYQNLLALHSINAAHQSRLRIFLQSLTQWIHFQSGSKQRSQKPKQQIKSQIVP